MTSVADFGGLSASKYFDLGFTITKVKDDTGRQITTITYDDVNTDDGKRDAYVFDFTNVNGIKYSISYDINQLGNTNKNSGWIGTVRSNRIGFFVAEFAAKEEITSGSDYYSSIIVKDSPDPTLENAGLNFDWDTCTYTDADGMQVRITSFSFADRQYVAEEVRVNDDGVIVNAGKGVAYRIESQRQKDEALINLISL